MRRLTIAVKAMLLVCSPLLVLAIGDSTAQSALARTGKTPVNAPNTTVIYRCTDAGGTLSLQSAPCPRGQRQERSVIARPLDPVPSPAAATSGAPVITIAQPPAITPAPSLPADGEPLPPPPLYRCQPPSGGNYVSDTDTPPERCRAVPLVNLSSSGTVPEHDARMECEMERDRCARIPDQELCTGWKQRLGEARAVLELGNPDLVERATRQRDQAQQVMNRSCLKET